MKNLTLLFLLCTLLTYSSSSLFQKQEPIKDFLPDNWASCLNLWSYPKECSHSEFSSKIDTSKYEFEEHEVITEDGYINTMFRVRLNQELFNKLSDERKANRNKPLLLQHGLGGDSMQWIGRGDTENTVGFYLIHQGFDCWFSDSRGNIFSRRHRNPNISHKDFFSYTWTEMGLYDQPANFRLIQSVYNNPDQKIIYMAHSQGTTQMFAALQDKKTKDFFVKNIERFFAMSPVVFQTKASNAAAQISSKFVSEAVPLAKFFGVNWVCGDGCNDSMKGYCVKNALHFAQMIEGKGSNHEAVFRDFDYGNEKENQEKYGQSTPPEWDQGSFPEIKLTLQSNNEDDLATPENIDILRNKIGINDYMFNEVAGWGHNGIFDSNDKTPVYRILDRDLGLTPL